MNRSDIKKDLLSGEKISHRLFADGQFLQLRDGDLYDENDIKCCSLHSFLKYNELDNNWYII